MYSKPLLYIAFSIHPPTTSSPTHSLPHSVHNMFATLWVPSFFTQLWRYGDLPANINERRSSMTLNSTMAAAAVGMATTARYGGGFNSREKRRSSLTAATTTTATATTLSDRALGLEFQSKGGGRIRPVEEDNLGVHYDCDNNSNTVLDTQ